MQEDADERAIRHRRLGWVLAGLGFLDLAWFRAASAGRDATMRLVGRPSAGLCALGFAAAAILAVHGTLGVIRFRRDRGDYPYGDRDRRKLQWMTAFAIVPFVCLRLAYGPMLAAVRGLDGLGLHQRMLDELGSPALVVVQCLGVSAFGLHMFQGLAASAKMASRVALVPIAFALAALYVFVYVDSLAVFVVGRPIWPRG